MQATGDSLHVMGIMRVGDNLHVMGIMRVGDSLHVMVQSAPHSCSANLGIGVQVGSMRLHEATAASAGTYNETRVPPAGLWPARPVIFESGSGQGHSCMRLKSSFNRAPVLVSSQEDKPNLLANISHLAFGIIRVRLWVGL